MKKIVVPCDFSEQAISALRVAVDIAKMGNGTIHLINVVELPIMNDSVMMPVLSLEEDMLTALKSNATNQFEKLKRKYGADCKIESQVIFGGTSTMIIDYVETHGIDLVVMGTKGASGFREMVIGSNAEKIVRHAKVPVIVVKKYTKVSSIKNIVFPNTLQKDQEDLTMKVKALQHFFKAKLHVVFVNTPSNFSRDVVTLQKLTSFAKRFMLKDYTLNIYNDNSEEDGVINFTHEIKADLIAMGTHGRKGLSHVLSGSVAEDVVNHVDFPIWTNAITV